MAIVHSIIKHFFPQGTRGEGSDSISDYPDWPPDMFAVTATLVEMSGCYTLWTREDDGPFHPMRTNRQRAKLRKIGAAWKYRIWSLPAEAQREAARIESIPSLPRVTERDIQSLWSKLYSCQDQITDFNKKSGWAVAAMKLMIIADEACEGIGFSEGVESVPSLVVAYHRYSNSLPGEEALAAIIARDHPVEEFRQSMRLEAKVSACICVPPEIACVQPKTRTPRVGCTVRSLSLHLALLPPKGHVQVRWNQFDAPAGEQPFNLLIVPFPYRIHGRSFSEDRKGQSAERQWRTFALTQDWLPNKSSNAKGSKDTFWNFLKSLIEEAEREVNSVDGIVLPELALDEATYFQTASELKERLNSKLGFFVAGVLATDSDRRAAKKNSAYTSVFVKQPDDNPRRPDTSSADFVIANQDKHHRWKLDAAQIRQYSIGDALDPAVSWWEGIDVSDRNLNFFVFRHGACFSTLVCEDLARVDPCQTVLRAIGPNLVIALLMDGPQLSNRWPGRYAMGLADDPGSSVLSVTSLGLVNRSNNKHGTSKRAIGLWRDCLGETRELDLPKGDHALLLTITGDTREERTLDGRSDFGTAYYMTLSGVTPVRIRGNVPKWLGVG